MATKKKKKVGKAIKAKTSMTDVRVRKSSRVKKAKKNLEDHNEFVKRARGGLARAQRTQAASRLAKAKRKARKTIEKRKKK